MFIWLRVQGLESSVNKEFLTVNDILIHVDTEFLGLVKMSNFALGKLIFSKMEFAKLFLQFLKRKSDFAEFCNF